MKKIFTKIFSISLGLILLGFVAAEEHDWRQHALFLRTFATVLLALPFGWLVARTRFLTTMAAVFVIFALANGTCFADSRITVAGLLTKSLRAYEANRPMEAEEFWRKASHIEPRIARPPWLTPGQELPANLKVESFDETTGYSLWGLFVRLLTLPVLLVLLVWQAWKAIHDIRDQIEVKSKKPVAQSSSCPECVRLTQEYNKLQRKFELLQKTAAGNPDQ